MAHYVSSNTPLTSKKISKESEEPVKFKAKTESGKTTITVVAASETKLPLIVAGEVLTVSAGVVATETTVVSVNKSVVTLNKAIEKTEAEFEFEIKTPVFKPYIFTSQPVQTDFAEYITGVVSSDKGGTLEIQQTFGYPADHENDTKAAEGITWVPGSAAITVVEKVGQAFQVYAYAPYFRLVYTNGETAQGTFALQARAQEKGRL